MTIGNGDILKNAVSPIGAIVAEDLANNKVFDESVFSISKRLAIPGSGGGSIYIAFDPTACTCDFLVFLPAVFKAFGAGPIFIDTFVNPVFSGGSIIQSVNRDFTSSETSEVVWTLSPTVTDEGTQLPTEFAIFSNGTAAISTVGGESKEDLVLNIDMSKKYLFKLSNQETTAADGLIVANWFEL